MMARSDGHVARALGDGAARVLSAPAVLAGTLALTLAFSLTPGLYPGTVALAQYTAIAPLLPFGIFLYAPYNFTWLLVWSFLGGGILDRYARNRPTRGRGFFGACGAHFPAMLRLGVIELLLFLGIRSVVTGNLAMSLFLAASLFLVYARVRLVVEDRRSAIGALLAGGRFIRRNAAAAGVFLFFATALWIAGLLWLRVPVDPGEWASLAFAAGEILIALQLFLVFALWASATALFQSRLAHAAYTAGPPIEWPESPAAEAIANLSPPVDPRERSGASDEARAQRSEPERGAGGNRRDAPAPVDPRERSGASDEARAQHSEPERGAGGNRRDAPAPSAKK